MTLSDPRPRFQDTVECLAGSNKGRRGIVVRRTPGMTSSDPVRVTVNFGWHRSSVVFEKNLRVVSRSGEDG